MEDRTLFGDLRRYLVEYRWEWGIIHKVINRWYGTEHTISDLKRLYQDERAQSGHSGRLVTPQQ